MRRVELRAPRCEMIQEQKRNFGPRFASIPVSIEATTFTNVPVWRKERGNRTVPVRCWREAGGLPGAWLLGSSLHRTRTQSQGCCRVCSLDQGCQTATVRESRRCTCTIPGSRCVRANCRKKRSPRMGGKSVGPGFGWLRCSL